MVDSEARQPISSDNASLRQVPGCFSQTLGDEAVIMPQHGEAVDLQRACLLTGTGATVWSLLSSPTTCADIAQALARDYEVSCEQAAVDVREFLDSMMSLGLVEKVVT